MLYSIYGGKNHPECKLQATDHDACRSSMYKGEVYNGDFNADDFNRDDFHFTDVIESFCVPVFNDKFKLACEAITHGAVSFRRTNLIWGKENLLEWVGDEIKGFYVVHPKIVDIIDESKSPTQFWPKLKKFKHQDYVITGLPDTEIGVFVDLKRPHLFIITEDMKRSLDAHGIQASFEELPVVT